MSEGRLGCLVLCHFLLSLSIHLSLVFCLAFGSNRAKQVWGRELPVIGKLLLLLYLRSLNIKLRLLFLVREEEDGEDGKETY